ncbi:hypothetical protein [Niabella hibiscisoli]|uniref:hypothetical protein n=1 Tax=Niabella hibiscisoli TaxID=1825928 RepID=UPI001F0D2D94|nr:hypothetical protein [Niabella hibiscisoli]MCH5720545.1 hypothetical protein [Niabella hibiscisoli]
MTRNTIAIFLFCLTLSACRQIKNFETINGLTIDPNIKSEVEKHIETSKEYEMFGDKMQVYLNSGEIQSYENDSLIFTTKIGKNKTPFKSFYLWHNDTLTIDGAYGIWGGSGFGIEIVNNKARLYHMLSSDDFPTYAYNEKDSLIFRLEVPCTDTKITLSEIPDSTKKQIIYGYIEFKSENFYSSSGSENNQEILPRRKIRNNMKLYFKSGYLNFKTK